MIVGRVFSTPKVCSGVSRGPLMEPGPLSAVLMMCVTQRGNVSNGNDLCRRRIGPDLSGHPLGRGLNLFTHRVPSRT